MNQGRAQPSEPKGRDVSEPQTTDMNDQTGYLRDATATATAFELLLNRSLEKFITRLSRTNERSEKSEGLF